MLGHTLFMLLTKKVGCAPEGVNLGGEDGEGSDGVVERVHF